MKIIRNLEYSRTPTNIATQTVFYILLQNPMLYSCCRNVLSMATKTGAQGVQILQGMKGCLDLLELNYGQQNCKKEVN